MEQGALEADEQATPADRDQRSFTNPERRMIKTNDRFHHAHDAQGVVDERGQVIPARMVTNQAGPTITECLPSRRTQTSDQARWLDRTHAPGVVYQPGVLTRRGEVNGRCVHDDRTDGAV